MLLIGMFDSPFVRRVGISLRLLGIVYEHANWSVGKDAERIRKYNPLGRVPTLVLDDGEALIESSMILDWLDQQVGPARALLPSSGRARVRAQKIVALALGAGEKARELVYEEIMRPAELRHAPWQERCRAQLRGALTELNELCKARREDAWLLGEKLTQADITAACIFSFVSEAGPVGVAGSDYPALAALSARAEARAEFAAVKAPWFAFTPAGS